MSQKGTPNRDSKWVILTTIATALAVKADPVLAGTTVLLIVLYMLTLDR